MVKFCSKCGSIMVPKVKDGVKILVCRRCGHEEPLEEETAKAYQVKQKIKHAPDEGVIVVEQDVRTLPIAKGIKCPKCDNEEAYWWELQTRAGDEPSTIFYKCTKCGHTWRSYE
ncbi:hypothetical protein PAP_03275 [Palaeococcus pacificus DY20341]|uniref:Transcription factor S n=1 Tax=Palaeococcus pacificus DY20341 TaxID=1343739 RepID=A0A075LQS4_9EURY|nr:transcription factor S [Palaeococcus pacificus]AIF69075.1 hypothetical protein PAP_03275 [Palaeococcus pacificus DY20341]